jgi:hypothetical protein
MENLLFAHLHLLPEATSAGYEMSLHRARFYLAELQKVFLFIFFFSQNT